MNAARKRKLSFDQNAFAENFSGMFDLAHQTFNEYLKVLPSFLLEIEDALRRADSRSLELSAHKLKGTVSNFFADSSVSLAWKLEQMARGKIDQSTWACFNELKAELAYLETDLKNYLKATDRND